jgi:hypothetical protein
VENRSNLISTVWKTPYPGKPTWTNILPRHFCRGPASHNPFDSLPLFYPFYMFYTAKTFSVHRRVRNHYSKRILNLILNRKKFLRRENEALAKQNRGETAAALPRTRLSELTERRRAQGLRRKTRHSGISEGKRGGGANVRASGYGVFAEVPRGGAFGHR